MSEVRLPRRRRSVSLSPVVIDPADIPEDAAGRVEVLAIRAPADVIDPGEPHPPPAPAPSRLPALLMAHGGWFTVAATCVVLGVLFTIGMVLTR